MRPAAEAAAARTGRRLLLLSLAVALVHLWLVDRHLPSRLGEGAADSPPRRIDVSFVRELAPAAPPAAAPAAAAAVAAPHPARALGHALAASPAVPAASAPEPPIEPAADIAPEPALASVLANLPELPASAADLSTTQMPFEWPPSTRLTYALTGDYRGPVVGAAVVEWLRDGPHYQVRMDVSAGMLFNRSVTSAGEITPEGLKPRRYDEETKVLLRDARRLTVWLDDERIRLANGSQSPRPAGVQDSASQFVQMTWFFTMHPDWLEKGRTVEMPLALPRRVETWVYEVLDTEVLQTRAGPVEAVHVKPRREGKANELTPEMWVAPSLQYLPVRLLIRQDAQTYIDLLLDRLPQQTDPGR